MHEGIVTALKRDENKHEKVIDFYRRIHSIIKKYENNYTSDQIQSVFNFSSINNILCLQQNK